MVTGERYEMTVGIPPSTKGQWAEAYARRGIFVFPCREVGRKGVCSCGKGANCPYIGKHPYWDEQDLVKGSSNATTDYELVGRWWTRWANANIGARMELSGLVGIDIDPRNGGDESWVELCSRLHLDRYPKTWTNLTGGGGQQFYFRAPEGFLRDKKPGKEVAKGIDLLWKGYGILPPSNHRSGGTYAWETGDSPLDYSEPMMLPYELCVHIEGLATREDEQSERTPFAEKFERIYEEGTRRMGVVSVAGWCREEGIPEDVAAVLIHDWAEKHTVPPLPPAEVEQQFRDVYKRYDPPAKAILNDDPPPPPSSPDDWKLIRGHDLRRMALPPVEWLLEGMIPAGKYVVLSGDSGLGKSWWMLLFILCSTRGLPFLGKKTAPMRALYIDEENGVQEAQRRLRALADGIGIPEDDDLGVDFLIDESVKPGKELHRTRLADLIKKEGYTFIATDSLIRFFDGNENNSDEVKRFHESIDWIKRQTGVGWGMLQHLNKAGKDGKDISAGDRLRGSGEFKAHADVHIQLRTVDNGATIITHVEKLRGGIKPEDVVYRMDGNTMLDEPVVFTLLETTAAAYGAENAALIHALELLDSASEYTVGTLIDALAKKYGIAARTAERAIKLGRTSGSIVDRKEGRTVYVRRGRMSDD